MLLEKYIKKFSFRSFPSGHTSAAFSGSTFMALYCFYWFGKIDSAMNLGTRNRHLHFPGTSLRIGILFLWFVPAFYVGISRTQVCFSVRHFYFQKWNLLGLPPPRDGYHWWCHYRHIFRPIYICTVLRYFQNKSNRSW